MRSGRPAGPAFSFRILLIAALAIQVTSKERIQAGSFLFSNENFPNTVTHPPNYDPLVGGVVTVGVCIDPAAANATATEMPVQSAIGVLNSLAPQSPNLVLGAGNNIPPGMFDFESLVLHQLGHCIGLDHPNLGIQDGVSGIDTDYTQSAEGDCPSPPPPSPPECLTFEFDDGADNVIGSSDDFRDDDVNLHWFVDNVNDPFAPPPATIDSTNYTREQGDLPSGHTFIANASRDVGSLLGFPSTEAVMQQGQNFDEAQRELQADDVATLRFAMTGLDEVAGTPDDYTINMTYEGLTTSCDVVIKSTNSGFGACSVSFTLTDESGSNQDHLTILGAELTYNAEGFTWFFSCSAGDNNLTVTGMDSGTETYEACVSITIGPYTATDSSEVTVRAASIKIENNTSIAGTFVADSAVP